MVFSVVYGPIELNEFQRIYFNHAYSQVVVYHHLLLHILTCHQPITDECVVRKAATGVSGYALSQIFPRITAEGGNKGLINLSQSPFLQKSFAADSYQAGYRFLFLLSGLIARLVVTTKKPLQKRNSSSIMQKLSFQELFFKLQLVLVLYCCW